MASNNKDDKLLARLLEPLVVNQGFTESPLKNVKFVRSDQPIPRSPIIYDPNIVIIAQGHKTGYLGNNIYRYDANDYLCFQSHFHLNVKLPAHRKSFFKV